MWIPQWKAMQSPFLPGEHKNCSWGRSALGDRQSHKGFPTRKGSAGRAVVVCTKLIKRPNELGCCHLPVWKGPCREDSLAKICGKGAFLHLPHHIPAKDISICGGMETRTGLDCWSAGKCTLYMFKSTLSLIIPSRKIGQQPNSLTQTFFLEWSYPRSCSLLFPLLTW